MPCKCRHLPPGNVCSPDVVIWWCCTAGLQVKTRRSCSSCELFLRRASSPLLGSVPDARIQGSGMQHVQAAQGGHACLLLCLLVTHMQSSLEALPSCQHACRLALLFRASCTSCPVLAAIDCGLGRPGRTMHTCLPPDLSASFTRQSRAAEAHLPRKQKASARTELYACWWNASSEPKTAALTLATCLAGKQRQPAVERHWVLPAGYHLQRRRCHQSELLRGAEAALPGSRWFKRLPCPRAQGGPAGSLMLCR